MNQQTPAPASSPGRFRPESQERPLAGSGRWWPRFFIPLACALLCVAIVVPWIAHAAGAAGGGFNGVVGAVEHRYHVHARRIPFMFLASIVANKATNGGVAGVRVAEIEHFSQEADGDELNRIVEEKLGAGWQRMIRSTSRHGGEQTLIFARPDGRRMGLFILDLDGQEMDVVQVSVDPDHLNETIGKYDHQDHTGDQSDSD
jgi:hypothetical protein